VGRWALAGYRVRAAGGGAPVWAGRRAKAVGHAGGGAPPCAGGGAAKRRSGGGASAGWGGRGGRRRWGHAGGGAPPCAGGAGRRAGRRGVGRDGGARVCVGGREVTVGWPVCLSVDGPFVECPDLALGLPVCRVLDRGTRQTCFPFFLNLNPKPHCIVFFFKKNTTLSSTGRRGNRQTFFKKFGTLFAECPHGHSAKRTLCRVPGSWHSAKSMFAECQKMTLGKPIFFCILTSKLFL